MDTKELPLCFKCSIPMRKQGSPPLAGTRIHQAKGHCSYCYQRKLENGEFTAKPAKKFNDTHILCSSCDQWKEYIKFKRLKGPITGRDYTCSLCRKLWERYRLTYERYNAMLIEQDNRCYICQVRFKEITKCVVDHDHNCCSNGPSCGKCVRGLLCDLCNRGIGALRDSPDNLRRAALYLEGYNEKTTN